MNVIQAIQDENLFKPYLGDDLLTWRNWMTALRVTYGLPLKPRESEVIKQCTGRDANLLPKQGFDTALFLTGRRSGKSRIAALIAAYEAALTSTHRKLAPGETGYVPVISPTKSQSRIVRDYIRGVFDSTPMLQREVVRETKDSFELRNGVIIEILAGDFRSIRGFTLLAAVIDEACFLGLEAESKVRSDTELIRAIKPALATTGGKLILISSPYAKRGHCYKTWRLHFGNDNGSTLVWNCPSRTMNPSLPQRIIDEALAEDLQAAKSEYLGEWRDDIAEFLPRSVLENLVIPGRFELMPRDSITYSAFADLSGGRGDDAALAIAHQKNGKTILDLARVWKPPFDPRRVIGEMAEILRKYGVRKVTGDNYAAEFVASAFTNARIKYTQSDKPKSQLYVELLPRLCSGEIELLDSDTLINQLAGLERRTRSGGKDIIDHPPGSHDDLANAVAGVVVSSTKKVIRVGAF